MSVIEIDLLLLATGSNAVVKSRPLTELSEFINQTYSSLDKPGDREFDTEELFKFNSVPVGTYNFGLRTRIGSGGDLTVTAAPDNDTDSEIRITKVNQAADGREIDIAQNMPYGTDGILLEDFIKSMQTKYNLVIYPSKTKPREFIIEPYNDWTKNYEIKEWDKFIDVGAKMEVIPANNQGFQEFELGDTLDVDYIADEFKKRNNRDFGSVYYKDKENIFSAGKKQVETSFGVSPLVYVENSGLSGSLDIESGFPLTVHLGTSEVTVCDSPEVTVFTPIQRGELVVGDILYEDLYLTKPVQGLAYAANPDKRNLIFIEPSTGLVTFISRTSCAEVERGFED